MTTEDILEILKASKPLLRQKFRVSEVGLFGSFSKREHHSQSDIDILYTLEEGTKFGLKDACELEVFMKELLKNEKIDLVNKKYLNPVIALEIENSLVYV